LARNKDRGLIRRKQQEPEPTPTLITLKQAAEMLCLTPSAIRQRKAGTDVLTLVRQGTGKRQPIFLIKEEVEMHIRSLVDHARRQNRRPQELVFGT
jgi:hypothetical protein